MGYWINKDIPLKRATVHRDILDPQNRKYRNCWPQQKRKEDGEWEHVETIPTTISYRNKPLQIKLCTYCKP